MRPVYPSPLGVVLAVYFLFASAGFASTIWYVAPEFDPDEDGTIDHPFNTLAKGIAAASSGDVVRVLEGVYTGPGNVELVITQSGLRIESAAGPAETVIAGSNAVFAFRLPSTHAPHMELAGFEFRSFNTEPLSEDGSPGDSLYELGFHGTSSVIIVEAGAVLTLADSWFSSNQSYSVYRETRAGTPEESGSLHVEADGTGAALRIHGGVVHAEDCRFEWNRAGRDGGALFASDGAVLSFSNCLFRGNRAGLAGRADWNTSSYPLITNHFPHGGGAVACTRMIPR